MTRYVEWMREHRLFNTILVIAYYIAVVAPHKRFGAFLNKYILVGIFRTKELRDYYNEIILMVAVAALLIYLAAFIYQSLKRDDRYKLWSYMVTNIILTGVIIKVLFVINTEVIHIPQYAVFALLIFPLTFNYFSTLIWATIGGAIDEAYQNFYLAPADTGYFDWNDVLTNLVGAVYGLLLLRAIGLPNKMITQWWKSSAPIAVLSIFALVGILNVSGVLSMGPDFDYPYQMLSKELTGFWEIWAGQSTADDPGIKYHIVRPLEGLILTFLLWSFYSRIGR